MVSSTEIANIVIAALAFLATAGAAIATGVTYFILERDETNKKHQLSAQLEASYQNARKHNRKIREELLTRAFSTTKSAELDPEPATFPLARDYYMATFGHYKMADHLRTTIGDAIDESATIWENVVVQLQGGLLPASFFGAGQEWRVRAVKYIKEMEPFDVANWYRYNVKLPAGAGTGDIPSDKRYPAHRPRRYKVLTEKLGELSSSLLDLDKLDDKFRKACKIGSIPASADGQAGGTTQRAIASEAPQLPLASEQETQPDPPLAKEAVRSRSVVKQPDPSLASLGRNSTSFR